ncbi:hypothetical protein [Nocardioides perillae]|uniref:DUF3352 domain-containing protein n=1 Tax=Nocardioides perillae TaxID=1119534 RepID=A0A7Y9RQW6_9ACTN|nr:hypothetical protein [Nocardioides perillae]NYG54655.1 hypothetical protein [Nocardioides perillae]
MSETAPPAPARRRAWPVLALVVVLLAGAAVAGTLWWRGRGTDLERAAAWAPPTTERLSWVDWSGVRRELGADLDADSDGDALADFLARAFEADLSATSSLVQSAPALQRELGLSPATVDWEAFTQSAEGALTTLGAGEVDLDELGDDLEALGWRRPPDDDGVWVGGTDLVAGIDPALTPQVSFVAILEDEGLVLTSDEADYLESGVAAVRSDAEAGVEPLVDVAGALTADGASPLAASLLTGANACVALAMAQADDAAQAEADALLAAAGETRPYAALGTALLPGAGESGEEAVGARVAMLFETDDQARAEADVRAQLAVGPAPGQGGDFADRFALVEARAEGSAVVLDLDPVDGAYVLSDLSNGPVLYATC